MGRGGPYPEYNALTFTNGKGYEFRNEKSNKLLITLGGFSWNAIRTHTRSGLPAWVMPLRDRYTIFVVEKFDREIGGFYINNIAERERYTIDNLLDNYASVINEYLAQNNFESIVIAGQSEGAILLPILYSRLDNPAITALIANGGTIIPANTQFNLLPDSTDLIHPGNRSSTTNRYENSWVGKQTSTYLENMDIPFLFLHGMKDQRVPVFWITNFESFLRLQNKEKPFTFIYYEDMGHWPTEGETLAQWRRDVIDWLAKVDP
jgi:pimeloyl-ACP methyl ester carboxylesterase